MSVVDDGNNMVMPVSPMYGGAGNGMLGNDGAWWVLILLFALGGWGNNGFGANGGNGSMPYLLNSQTQNDVNRGFDNLALSNQITGLQNSLNENILTSMNQRFSDTFALMNNLNAINSSLQQCCCENRAAVADLKYTVATEACADRAAVGNGVQRILDQMCQDKIDAKNEKIADLERQLTMANLAASQTAQTSRILADNAAQTVALEQYLNPVPVPAYVVQNPNCCSNNYGCGCNNGNF